MYVQCMNVFQLKFLIAFWALLARHFILAIINEFDKKGAKIVLHENNMEDPTTSEPVKGQFFFLY